MSQPGQSNSMWISRVRALLGQGYGVHDIAVKLDCGADEVRNEVQIYRETGELQKILGVE